MRGWGKAVRCITVLLVAAWGSIGLSVPASATMVTSTLNVDFSDVISSGGTLTATFDDGDTSGSVTLTINASALTPSSAFIGAFWFNYDGDATTLSFANQTNASAIIQTCNNCTGGGNQQFRPGPDGFFDILLDFPQPSGATRFNAGEIYTVDITKAGIVASDLNLLSISAPGGGGTWCTAAHVQGTGTGDGSDFLGGLCSVPLDQVVVPEPATLFLLGAGLIGVGVAARRKQLRR